MLTPYKPQFVEKIFTDQMGQQFRLVFLVTIIDGEVKGRLVSAQPIAKSVAEQPCATCLPVTLNIKKGDTAYIAPSVPVVSPYNELFFFISQPTRAPSLI